MAKLGQYNLDEMTAQEAFEAGASHLLEQSVKSVVIDEDGYPSCVYNGGGVCCPAAIFIQCYVRSMEGSTWWGLVDDFGQTAKHMDIVKSLQSVHDNGNVSEWKDSLEDVVVFCNLDTSFLDWWQWSEALDKWVKHES